MAKTYKPPVTRRKVGKNVSRVMKMAKKAYMRKKQIGGYTA